MAVGKKRALEMIDAIVNMFPDAECELKRDNPFKLIAAVLLLTQCISVLVSRVATEPFKEYKAPEDCLVISDEELMSDARSIGLYRNRAGNIKKPCQSLVDQSNGETSQTHEEPESLADAGCKTASVVMSVVFDKPSLAVDTHVERVSKRLGINRWKDNVRQIEDRSCFVMPRGRWNRSHHQLILFGGYHCLARKSRCDVCPLLEDYREGQKRYKVSLRKV